MNMLADTYINYQIEQVISVHICKFSEIGRENTIKKEKQIGNT